MALQRAKLSEVAYLLAAPSVLVANGAAQKTYVKGVILFNSHSATEVVRVYMVPDNAGALGVAGVPNQLYEISLAAKETVLLPLNVDGQPLVLTDTNDSVQASTTGANRVTGLVLGDRE